MGQHSGYSPLYFLQWLDFHKENWRFDLIGGRMEIVAKAKAFGRLVEQFEEWGYTVDEITDLTLLDGLLESAGKPYLSSFGSPHFNDFTQKTVLWLVIRDGDTPAYIGCARLEDLGSERLDSYLRRIIHRHHGADQDFIGMRPSIVSQIRGKLAYFGDLYVMQGHRGSRDKLRAFLALGHLAVSLKWDPDWTYCFIREQHMMRGSATLYGFTQVFSEPFDWVRPPPFPRTATDWLVAVPRDDMLPTVMNTVNKVCF